MTDYTALSGLKCILGAFVDSGGLPERQRERERERERERKRERESGGEMCVCVCGCKNIELVPLI